MRDRLRRLALAEAMSGQTPRRAYSPIVLSGLVRLIEFCAILVTGIAAHKLYIGSAIPTAYFIAEPAVAFVALITFQALGLNTTGAYRNPVPAGFRLVGGWTAILLVALALVFFLRLELVFSRVWIVAWYISGLAVLLSGRVALSLIVRRMTASGQLDRRTVIVRGERAAFKLADIELPGPCIDIDEHRLSADHQHVLEVPLEVVSRENHFVVGADFRPCSANSTAAVPLHVSTTCSHPWQRRESFGQFTAVRTVVLAPRAVRRTRVATPPRPLRREAAKPAAVVGREDCSWLLMVLWGVIRAIRCPPRC